jgi:hypothetical protein
MGRVRLQYAAEKAYGNAGETDNDGEVESNKEGIPSSA